MSKFLLYQFHFDYVLKTFDCAKLLFADTDSVVYEIHDQCFKDKELFDFSGYPTDSINFDDSNKKVLGKMKDGFNGRKIHEFFGSKSKMYSLLNCDDMNAKHSLEVNKVR